MKTAPLASPERAQGKVGKTRRCAKYTLRLIEDDVEICESLRNRTDQLIA
jgi:hypothetical protein